MLCTRLLYGSPSRLTHVALKAEIETSKLRQLPVLTYQINFKGNFLSKAVGKKVETTERNSR